MSQKDPTAAGILYAQLGEYDQKYTTLARNIADHLTGKKDDLGAATILSYVNKEEAIGYADKLAEKGRYADAGLVYLTADQYDKAEDMVTLAAKKGNRAGAIMILQGLMEKDANAAANVISMKYEGGRKKKAQQGGQEQSEGDAAQQDDGYALAA